MPDCTGLLKSTFPNCTIHELSDGTETVRIEPTEISTAHEQYCIVIEEYIQTLGYETTVIDAERPYVEANAI